MSKRTLGIVCLLFMPALLTSCTGGGSASAGRVPVFKTSGKVTLFGSPVIGAMVSFSPQDNQPAAVGRTDDQGQFALTTYGGNDGAAAGEFKVVVVHIETATAAAPDAAHSPDGRSVANSHSAQTSTKAAGNLLPAQYSDPAKTPLTAKVEQNGANIFNFDLK
jgi:hypothetical protein